MSSPVESNDYLSAVQRLQALISELRDLAEERLGLQHISAKQPDRLSNLWEAISLTLAQIRAITHDSATREAARDRQLAFDEIVDPIYQHMSYKYSDPTQAFDAWGKYRHRLRAELDVLGAWASALIIASCVLMGGMRLADNDNSRRMRVADQESIVTELAYEIKRVS